MGFMVSFRRPVEHEHGTLNKTVNLLHLVNHMNPARV
jgi:hypothetical protein